MYKRDRRYVIKRNPSDTGRSYSLSTDETKAQPQADEEVAIQSEYYPVAIQGFGMGWQMIAIIVTDPFKPHRKVLLPKIGSQAIGHHGGGFNNNGGMCFTKYELSQLVMNMEDDDRLMIVAPDKVDRQQIIADIQSITK